MSSARHLHFHESGLDFETPVGEDAANDGRFAHSAKANASAFFDGGGGGRGGFRTHSAE